MLFSRIPLGRVRKTSRYYRQQPNERQALNPETLYHFLLGSHHLKQIGLAYLTWCRLRAENNNNDKKVQQLTLHCPGSLTSIWRLISIFSCVSSYLPPVATHN